MVVGVVETHGRYETAGAARSGSRCCRGARSRTAAASLEEFDLDAALARRPKILLLDELAHTNAPGSRHAKRWQDVLELLDAGHRGLHDAERAARREPERRGRADHARAGPRDRPGLRPRARRRDRARRHRTRGAARAAAGGEGLLPRAGGARARALLPARQPARAARARAAPHGRARGRGRARVPRGAGRRPRRGRPRSASSSASGPRPTPRALVRAARRIAAGLRAPWIAAAVEATGRPPLSEEDRERLEAHLRLAESLGAEVVRLSGRRTSPEAILDFARRRNVTRIVLGKPRAPALARSAARLAGGRDHPRERRHRRARDLRRGRRRRAPARGAARAAPPPVREYVRAAAVIAVTTAAGALVRASARRARRRDAVPARRSWSSR